MTPKTSKPKKPTVKELQRLLREAMTYLDCYCEDSPTGTKLATEIRTALVAAGVVRAGLLSP